MTLGEQVRERRTELQLTQLKLCAKANLSLDTLSRLEQNKNSNITLQVVKQLSKALGDFKFDI